ncbi:MAG: tRNA lysidine(34) synthetase TilS [Spirochaetales bacterium]|nr:tRNA lysidine(34) synthetase TilS [Spirochaetales bacterium]
MKSIENKLLGILNQYLRNQRIPAKASILVAFSGGPDSVALASLFLSLKRPGALFLAYFDHGIRSEEELNREKEFVRHFAETSGLPLKIHGVPGGVLASEARRLERSVEDLAREYRYRFLETCLSELKCDYLAFGHNLDDHMETLIMRFFQGSGQEGLKGIPERRQKVLRPLLRVRKKEIMDYLESRELSYSLDSTNLQGNYIRNRIRRELLPVIEDIFPGYPHTVEAFTEKMSFAADFLETAGKSMEVWEPWEGGYRIPFDQFIAAHPALRIRWLYDLYDRSKGDRKKARLPYRVIQRALSWNGKEGGILFRWEGLQAIRRGGFIFWEEDIVLEEKKQYVILIDTERDLVIDRIMFHVRLWEDKPFIEKETLRVAAPPLLIRSKRDGDKLRIGRGRMDLNTLFSQWKVRPAHRWMIPIVEDREGIVAVLGEPFGYKNRYRSTGEKHGGERIYRIQTEVWVDG